MTLCCSIFFNTSKLIDCSGLTVIRTCTSPVRAKEGKSLAAVIAQYCIFHWISVKTKEISVEKNSYCPLYFTDKVKRIRWHQEYTYYWSVKGNIMRNHSNKEVRRLNKIWWKIINIRYYTQKPSLWSNASENHSALKRCVIKLTSVKCIIKNPRLTLKKFTTIHLSYSCLYILHTLPCSCIFSSRGISIL